MHLPFSSSQCVSIMPLQLIHCDIWGSAPSLTLACYSSFIIFVDDYTWFTWIYPLTHKSQVLHYFSILKTLTKNHLSTTVKTFQCDGALELNKGPFAHYLTTPGISYHISCPHTPQQNCLTKRKIRHITEIVRTLLLHAFLPKKFWFDAFTTTIYCINRLPTPILLHKSPYEILYHTPP